jgi:hypothetical protein
VTENGYQTEPEKDGKGGWGYSPPDKFEGPLPKYSWHSTGWDMTDEHPVVNVTKRLSVPVTLVSMKSCRE